MAPAFVRTIFTLTVIASAIEPGIAHAQRPDSSADLLNRRLRIVLCHEADPVQGLVVDAGPASLRLATEDQAYMVVPFVELRRLEARGRDRATWAIIGLFGGAAVGGIGYHAWSSMRNDHNDFGPLVAVFFVAPISALAGAVIGGVAAPEQWLNVRLPVHSACASR